MPEINLLNTHPHTKRNYEKRAEEKTPEIIRLAKQFGKEFFDGDRKCGYGGYKYDGRWKAVVERMKSYYHFPEDAAILDIGCGKGFLLYEFTQVLAQASVAGLDISQYAIDNAKEEVRPLLQVGNAVELPFEDNSFDLVISINTLHNLYNFDLKKALQEMQRVGKQNKYLVVDSYRTEQEKVNLLYWQVTCECFYTPQEWEWFFKESGYTGDYSYVFYE